MSIGYEEINLDAERTPDEASTGVIPEIVSSAPPAAETIQSPSDIDPDKLIEQANLLLQAVGKRKRDAVDNQSAPPANLSSFFGEMSLTLGTAFTSSQYDKFTAPAFIASFCVEGGSLIYNSFHTDRMQTVPHGKYAIQALYGNRPTSKTKKGDKLLMVHPPTSEVDSGDVIYDKQRLLLLDALTHTDADAFIVPLEKDVESRHAVPLSALTKQLKGVRCSLQYTKDAQALLLTKQELKELVTEEEIAGLPALLRRRVSQLYPSAAASLLRKPEVSPTATDEEKASIQDWHRNTRRETLERLLRAEFQSIHDDVTREQSGEMGPEKNSLEKHAVTAEANGEDQDVQGGYAMRYTKQHLTATVTEGALAFVDVQHMAWDKHPIADIALLGEERDDLKMVADRVKADDYTPMELLALAWQVEEREPQLKPISETNTAELPELRFRRPATLYSKGEALRSPAERTRFAKRLGATAGATAALMLWSELSSGSSGGFSGSATAGNATGLSC